MGGLRRYMPITWITAVVGSLALAGIPPFAGFFSKDAIIEAVHLSKIPGHGYAYFAVMAGVFITAFYSFRMLFLAFHGKPRFDISGGRDAHHGDGRGTGAHGGNAADGAGHGHDHAHHGGPPKESPWVVTVPLILLAIPSVFTGWTYIEPMLFGNYFAGSIVVRAGARGALGARRTNGTASPRWSSTGCSRCRSGSPSGASSPRGTATWSIPRCRSG